MKGHNKENKSKLLKSYLMIVILNSLLALGIFSFETLFQEITSNLFATILLLLMIVIFIFSIYALIKFKEEKLGKITFVLPVLNVILLLLLLIFSIILFFLNYKFGLDPALVTKSGIFYSLDIMINLFEISFASYLFYRFRT